MGKPLFEITVILLLTVANGLFAASELALVSVKKSRLEQLAQGGRGGAKAALKLAQNPGAMLATVQVGITLIGVINSIYAGENLVKYIEPSLEPLLGSAAGPVSYVLVVLLVTLLSLIVGELAPKRLALRNPENLAITVTPLMSALSVIAHPLVWLLERSTNALLFVFGVRGESQEHVTEEDVKALVEQAEESGSLEAVETQLIARVLRFNDRRAREIMTPRIELVLLDLRKPTRELLEFAERQQHSRYPAFRDDPDDIAGVLHLNDLLEVALHPEVTLVSKLRKPLYLPENVWANDALTAFHERRHTEALLVDEFGVVSGMVTANDLLSELVGVFGSDAPIDERLVQREDGSYLVDGGFAMHDLRARLTIPLVGDEDFTTLAGYVLHHVAHIPSVGEVFKVSTWRFEVVDMDGNRVDRILISPPAAP